MPEYHVLAEPTDYDVTECICDDEHFQIDGLAFYNVVTRNVEGLEQVTHEGVSTYACPALLDEFTVDYVATLDDDF